MDKIIDLLNCTDGELDDYEKIIIFCKKKIDDLNFIDNIEYIKHIQSLPYNERVIIEFKEFCNKNIPNGMTFYGDFWNLFCETDFYKKITENKFNKNDFTLFCEKTKNYDISGTCISFSEMRSRKFIIMNLTSNSDSYTTLNLSYNNIAETGINTLIPILEKEKNLKNINLSNCMLNDKCVFMIEKILCNKNIKKIIMSNNDITKDTQKIFKDKYGDICIF
jgi:hypothetical protein